MVLYIGHTYSSERGGRNAVKILSRIYNVLINQTVSHWHMCECSTCLYVPLLYTQLPLVAVTYYISETIGKQTRVFASMREQYMG